MSEQLLESVKSKYGAVAESGLSNNHAGVQGRSRSIRLYGRGADLDSRRSQYGAIMRQSHSDRAFEAGRSCG